MSTRDPDVATNGLPVIDRAALDRLAAAASPLTPEQCMKRAHAAGALVDVSNVDRSGPGDALLLWRTDSSEAWLNLWWQPRDTGYHDPGAITIHVYSPPLRAVGHYELKEGELRREACPADEPSGPSPALLSAMTPGSNN